MSSSRPRSHPGPSSPSSSDSRMSYSKLLHENQSLKRRLVQYAATLEQLTGHAKREITSSARARDEAIAAAADAAALRQSVSDLSSSRDRSDRAAREAHAALADRTSSLSRATDEIARLRSKLSDAETDRIALRDTRDALAAAERRIIAAETDARSQADRVATLEGRVSEAADRIAAAERLSRELGEVARHRDDLADKADRASREVSAAAQRDVHSKAQISRLMGDIDRLERETTKLRASLDERNRAHATVEERFRITDRELSSSESRRREAETRAEETVTALRKELDEVLKELSDRNSELAELRTQTARELDSSTAVEERDKLRISMRELQEELEESTEMLTRAAIDALGDKSRIRKLEDALSKTRDELGIERRERTTRDNKISSLVDEVTTYENQLDSLRAAKRALTDECHAYQLQIHEKDNLLATKLKELEDIGTQKNDRAFHADRLSLELSNTKNSLAKKENDHFNLSSEYNELCEELKSVTKDAEKMHLEVGHTRRELAKTSEQLATVTKEKERFEEAAAELQSARRQMQDLTSDLAEKEEELSTTKRSYSTLKNEMAESTREKKRLSDLLSEVSSDLQRANNELDLLRNLRKEQEALAARITSISETSTRELNTLKQVQSEQAQRLARNTVDEYHRRLETLQSTAKDDIARCVSDQLREDIMPHIMRAVDSKTKRMVHALARHVETFTLDENNGSYTSGRPNYASNKPIHDEDDVEQEDSLLRSNTNLATASGTSSGTRAVGPISPSASMSNSAYQSETRSYQPSQAAPSTAESRWASVLDASRVDSVEGSTVHASTTAADTLRSPAASLGRSAPLGDGMSTPSRTESPTEGRSETVDDDGATQGYSSRNIYREDVRRNIPSNTELLPDEKPERVTTTGVMSDVDRTAAALRTAREIVREAAQLEQKADDAQDQSDNDHLNLEEGEKNNEGDEGRTEKGEEEEEEEVEELDITENNGEHDLDDDDDDDDVGVDIEVEFDPREFMRQGGFASVVENLMGGHRNGNFREFTVESPFEEEEDEDDGESEHDETQDELGRGSVDNDGNPRESDPERDEHPEPDDDDIAHRGLSRPQQSNWKPQDDDVVGHSADGTAGKSVSEHDDHGYYDDEGPTESDTFGESETRDIDHTGEDSMEHSGRQADDGLGLAPEYDEYGGLAVAQPGDDEPEGSDGAPLQHEKDDEEGYMEASFEDENYDRIEGDQNTDTGALEERRKPERAATYGSSVVRIDADMEEDDETYNDDFDSEFVDDHDYEEDVSGAPASDLGPYSEHGDDSSYRATKSESLVDMDDDNAHDDDVLREMSHEGTSTEAIRGLPSEGTHTEEGSNVRISETESIGDESGRDIGPHAGSEEQYRFDNEGVRESDSPGSERDVVSRSVSRESSFHLADTETPAAVQGDEEREALPAIIDAGEIGDASHESTGEPDHDGEEYDEDEGYDEDGMHEEDYRDQYGSNGGSEEYEGYSHERGEESSEMDMMDDYDEPSGELNMSGEPESLGGSVVYVRNIPFNAEGELLDAQLMEPTSEHGEDNVHSGHEDAEHLNKIYVRHVESEVRVERTVSPSGREGPIVVDSTRTETIRTISEQQ